MKLAVPFPYRASFLPARARRPKDMMVIGWVDVDIQERSRSETTTVARLDIHMSEIRTMAPDSNLEGPMTSVDYLVLDGNLLRPCAELKLVENHISATLCQIPVTASILKHELPALVIQSCAAKDLRQWPILSSIDIVGRTAEERDLNGRIIATDRDAREAELVDAMSRSAFIDDVLHVPSLGPSLVVHSTHSGGHMPGKLQHRVVIQPSIEKGWTLALRTWNTRSIDHDDPRLGQIITHELEKARTRYGAKCCGTPLTKANVTTYDGFAEFRKLPPISGDIVRGLATLALARTRNHLNDMDTSSIRDYAALRNAMNNGASATVIATIGSSLGQKLEASPLNPRVLGEMCTFASMCRIMLSNREKARCDEPLVRP